MYFGGVVESMNCTDKAVVGWEDETEKRWKEKTEIKYFWCLLCLKRLYEHRRPCEWLARKPKWTMTEKEGEQVNGDFYVLHNAILGVDEPNLSLSSFL